MRSFRHRPAKPVGKVLAASADTTQGLAGRQATQTDDWRSNTHPAKPDKDVSTLGVGARNYALFGSFADRRER
ncbi:hypothetical protein [Bacteroides fluxus]|uniref:hypothetical protein n=1 Tax=Bacteroides fluxus TaxID=626930 RepID=UPI00266D7473|nr:hypothetical protein [Bacteroides fluxus]